MGSSTFILDGNNVKSIYADDDKSLLRNFKLANVERASYVEPSTTDRSCWVVDFTIQGGDVFHQDKDGNKFKTRSQALEFEKRLLLSYLAGNQTALLAVGGL